MLRIKSSVFSASSARSHAVVAVHPLRSSPRITGSPANAACSLKPSNLHYSCVRALHIIARAGSEQHVSELSAKLKALEAERDDAIHTAESAAKTAVRLVEMVNMMENLAEEKLRMGDEQGAREALKEKHSMQEIIEKNNARAQVSFTLAHKLAQKIGSVQSQLMSHVGGQRADADEDIPTYSYRGGAASSGSSSPLPTYSGVKPRWQESLESSMDRLQKQKQDSPRLTTEEKFQEARRRVHAREMNEQRAAGLSLAEAQARLRAQDVEMMEFVKRVMSRYRRGEYVSEGELELAFSMLERRLS